MPEFRSSLIAVAIAASLMPMALAAAEMGTPISAQELDSSIPAQDKITLKVPPGTPIKGISVDVTVNPETSGLTIYGYTSADTIRAISVEGGETAADWPFVRPNIWVKRAPGTTYQILTLGYRD
ncbi:MAG: hypothetical protein WBD42_11120 [Methylovirgula sp.]